MAHLISCGCCCHAGRNETILDDLLPMSAEAQDGFYESVGRRGSGKRMNQRSHTHPLQQLHLLQQPSSYMSLIYLATAPQRLFQQRYCQSGQHISRKRFRQW